MAYIYEHRNSRLIAKDSSKYEFIALGYTDEFAAEIALLDFADDALPNGHVYANHELTERYRTGTFRFRVSYRSPKSLTGGEELEQSEYSFSFDTTGGSEKVTQSLGTRAYSSVGRVTAQDDMFAGAIKVSGKAPNLQVEGVNLVVPSLKFQFRTAMKNSLVTIGYAKLVASLTGCTNEAAFPPPTMPFVDEQFDEETVLFLGCSGSWTSTGDIELTFHFDSGPDVDDLDVGDIIEIVKLPHEFIWFNQRIEDDATNKRTVLKHDLALVEKVYEKADLDKLFTGVS